MQNTDLIEASWARATSLSPPKAGKTALASAMALAIAKGTPFANT